MSTQNQSSVRLDAPTVEQVTNAIIGRTATAAATAVRDLYAPVLDARAVPTVGQWCEYFHPALEDVTRERDEALAALAESEAQHRAEFERSARLMRERDEARAAVARVEALLDSLDADEFIDRAFVSTKAIRAALRGDAEEASERPLIEEEARKRGLLPPSVADAEPDIEDWRWYDSAEEM